MSEWVKVSERLPEEGKIVDIKVSGGTIIRNVEFEYGRFWKKRIGKNAGHVWSASEWAYPEKTKKTKSSPEDVTLSDDVHTAIDSEGYGDG